MLFEISDLAVVDLSLGVLYFTLVNQVVIFPLACDHFPWWKDQGTLPIEFVAQAVAYIFVAVQELKMSLDFDAVLVGPSKDDSVAVDDLGLTLKLVVLPDSVYFVAVAVGLWQFLGGFVGGWHAQFLKLLHFPGVNIFVLPHLTFVFLILLVLHVVELTHKFGLKGSP